MSFNFVHMWIFLVIFGTYVVSCFFMNLKLWDDIEDGDRILGFIVCFTPVNLIFLLSVFFVSVIQTSIEWLKLCIKKKKEIKNKKKLFELHKDIDPYGEEDWSY